jgi:soluble lytic murein transglycosylase-like protein
MQQRYENVGHEPRVRAPSRLRNDTRALLRNPFVMGLVAVAAAVQGVATAHVGVASEETALRPETTVKATLVQSLAPVKVTAPVRLESIEKLQVQRAAARTEKKKESEALALAAKYRAKGYKVSDKLAHEIVAAARAYDIEPRVAFGLVRTESAFKTSATSHVGAIGLTQLMPATARWLQPGVTRSDLRSSRTNLRIGFRYLKDLVQKYDGDMELALLAYNRGPGTVDRVLRRGGNPDNGYADMVLERGRRRGH